MKIAVGAGRQRHDDADRAGGVGLRGGGRGEEQHRKYTTLQGDRRIFPALAFLLSRLFLRLLLQR